MTVAMYSEEPQSWQVFRKGGGPIGVRWVVRYCTVDILWVWVPDLQPLEVLVTFLLIERHEISWVGSYGNEVCEYQQWKFPWVCHILVSLVCLLLVSGM